MANIQTIVNDFSSGELTPRLKERVKLARYNNGVSLLENFIVTDQGGLKRRGGTRYNHTFINGRLEPFIFSAEDTFDLCFGDQQIRFSQDGSIINGGSQLVTNGFFDTDISGWTDASVAPSTFLFDSRGKAELTNGVSGSARMQQTIVVTADTIHKISLTCHSFSDLTVRLSCISMGATDLGTLTFNDGNVESQTLSFTPINPVVYIDIQLSGTNTGALVDNVVLQETETPLSITSPYLLAELDDLMFSQIGDAVFITHGNHITRRLTRLYDTFWRLEKEYFDCTGPYEDYNILTAITITPSATTGTATLTANHVLFNTDFIDRLLRLDHSGTVGTCRITAVTDEYTATCTIENDFGATTATSLWSFGYFYTNNWPRTSAIHEQRFILGGTLSYPDTIWGSQTADLLNMDLSDGTDDKAFVYTLGTGEVHIIKWLFASGVLSVGTSRGIFTITASTLGEALTPSNIKANKESPVNVKAINVIECNGVPVVVQKAGKKLREFIYRYDTNKYHTPDLSVLAEHLPLEGGGIKKVCFQSEPYSVIWVLTITGKLYGITYVRDLELVAWHRHTLGGNGTSDVIKSISVTPSSSGDVLRLLVQRYINSSTVYYLEELTVGLLDSGGISGSTFLDCHMSTISAPANNSIINLTHLRSENVAVLADAIVVKDVSVSSGGAITLAFTANTKCAGYNYNSNLQLLPLEAELNNGTTQGGQKRLVEFCIGLYRSCGLYVGSSSTDLKQEIFYRSTMGAGNQLFTGYIKRKPLWGWQEVIQPYIRQSDPLPCNILNIVSKVEVEEEQ